MSQDQYPSLTEMDVTRPEQIKHYTLHIEGNIDVLKIFYERKKGSFLPERKTFRFGRSAKMIATGDRNNPTSQVNEISPFLLAAIAELDSIVSAHKSVVDMKEHALERLSQLEQEIASAHEEIRTLLKKL
ncbi:DUF3461 family protein [Leucothrix arctica]|uniref:DUF3461 domain-containing protein n=1 Tax=Leucothrix arctica TaxID=1481894 RepID=A0A317C7R2_9GAMM|nr:DUF3461 family protein [Leucothrix arctica]PWQ94508.1 DUF3461 domain-containing protein [Leucothrix arctica]